jgi:hypothetical protein
MANFFIRGAFAVAAAAAAVVNFDTDSRLLKLCCNKDEAVATFVSKDMIRSFKTKLFKGIDKS